MAESLMQDAVFAAILDGTNEMHILDDDDAPTSKIDELKDVKRYENLFSWKVRESCISTDEPIEFETLDELRKSSEKRAQMVTFKDGSEVFCVYQ